MKNKLNVYRVGDGWLLIKRVGSAMYREWFGDKRYGTRKASRYAEDTRDLIEAIRE